MWNRSREYNSNRRTVQSKKNSRLLPGVSPLVYSRFLLDMAAFLSLTDMGKDLPEYEEIPVALKMPAAVEAEYKEIEKELKFVLKNDKKGRKENFVRLSQSSDRLPGSAL